jgi:hypothetical protein
MENNKYFTPEISDFCIGYEYETIYLKSVWTKESLRIMDAGWFFESYENDAVPTEFRVPYLTKEQIESEGWRHTGGKLISGAEQIFEKDNYMMLYSTDSKKIVFLIRDPSLVKDYYQEPTFRGECKDINTFRKLIKLLGI